jgi:hypothetical protein
MRVVYVDESARDGNVYFIGALVADVEAIAYIQSSLDRVAALVANTTPGFDPSAEFHGYDMFQGTGAWESVSAPLRAKASVLAIRAVAQSGATFIVRGIDVTRLHRKYQTPARTHELALAHALEEADAWLEQQGDHAIVVADEHHTEEDGRRRFRLMTLGPDSDYSTRAISRLVDSIYFGPSHHSRLLQAADVATYFTNRILTVPTEAPAAQPSMDKIATSLSSFTTTLFVWP